MKFEGKSVEAYLKQIPAEKRLVLESMRQTILDNLPTGFVEQISYGMLGYVVPHIIYPKGYHVNPSLPLPFLNLAAQKNYLALYHMGLYVDNALLQDFKNQFKQLCPYPLDIGKSCIRFKYGQEIPFSLIAALLQKIDVPKWISMYERHIIPPLR